MNLSRMKTPMFRFFFDAHAIDLSRCPAAVATLLLLGEDEGVAPI